MKNLNYPLDNSALSDLDHLFNIQEIYLSQASKLNGNMTLEDMKELLYFQEYSKIDEDTLLTFLNDLSIINSSIFLKVEPKVFIVYHIYKIIENNLWLFDIKKYKKKISFIYRFKEFSKNPNFQIYLENLQKIDKYIKSSPIYDLIDENDTPTNNRKKLSNAEELFEKCKETTKWMIVKNQLKRYISSVRSRFNEC
jgi:hypothetical protein